METLCKPFCLEQLPQGSFPIPRTAMCFIFAPSMPWWFCWVAADRAGGRAEEKSLTYKCVPSSSACVQNMWNLASSKALTWLCLQFSRPHSSGMWAVSLILLEVSLKLDGFCRALLNHGIYQDCHCRTVKISLPEKIFSLNGRACDVIITAFLCKSLSENNFGLNDVFFSCWQKIIHS